MSGACPTGSSTSRSRTRTPLPRLPGAVTAGGCSRRASTAPRSCSAAGPAPTCHAATTTQAPPRGAGRWVAPPGPTTAGLVPATFAPLLPDDRLFFLRGSGAQVLSVAFSPSGWRLATGDRDGAVRFYDCELCGGVAQLVPLAKRRLAALRPAR